MCIHEAGNITTNISGELAYIRCYNSQQLAKGFVLSEETIRELVCLNVQSIKIIYHGLHENILLQTRLQYILDNAVVHHKAGHKERLLTTQQLLK